MNKKTSRVNDIQKIPFKVSARTARLIGRENISTSKGAIIELVKNSYDADSPFTIIYFDNYYSVLHNEITMDFYNKLINKNIPKELLDLVYKNEDNIFVMNKNVDENVCMNLKNLISKFSSLYIIDAGEGMTQTIIKNYWMTIGTDNKVNNIYTKSNRVKAGAKGIGRFALDKLGGKCEMITVFNPDNHEIDVDEIGNKTDFNGYKWIVNWEDFEGDFKTIENVNAELIGLKEKPWLDFFDELVPISMLKQFDDLDYKKCKFGTILKITELRDIWDDYYVDQVYSDLEILVPPKESNEFRIFLINSLHPDKYGEIFGSVCDDFDYKIIAKANSNQEVKIKIIRNEHDVELIPPDFFKRSNMQKAPYTLEDFRRGYWKTTKTFSQLIPGYTEVDEDDIFKNVGTFEFTFYYLKRTYTTDDADRFFYKKFQPNLRKKWLDKFAGIKLFRDNFRVRPYGEVNDSSFDWLGLGIRKASSPAGISKDDGRYKTEVQNTAGTIKISRLTNVNFEDKSSREGLQENKIFYIFKTLITQIIAIFENDRAYIAREMKSFDNERYSEYRTRKEAEQLAKDIIQRNRDRKKNQSEDTSPNDDKDNQLIIIAEHSEKQEEEIEKLKEEQKLLRGLASSGIVLAAFSHDLSKLDDVLESRIEKLKKLFSEKIAETEYLNVEDRKNPYKQLEKIKNQDIKLRNWLNFSLEATRKDKRKRKQLLIKKYFIGFKEDWASILEERAIDFDISRVEDIDMRIFEIDFDSIFNNLLVNTIDAFVLSKINRNRKINVLTKSNSKDIIIEYYDNGPGISKDIDGPEKIFQPLFTTKRNPYSGEEIGTGLGMWIIKSIIEENDGMVRLLFPKVGFGIRITFPIKYKR
jgi:signal transduction histidine kinase